MQALDVAIAAIKFSGMNFRIAIHKFVMLSPLFRGVTTLQVRDFCKRTFVLFTSLLNYKKEVSFCAASSPVLFIWIVSSTL